MTRETGYYWVTTDFDRHLEIGLWVDDVARWVVNSSKKSLHDWEVEMCSGKVNPPLTEEDYEEDDYENEDYEEDDYKKGNYEEEDSWTCAWCGHVWD